MWILFSAAALACGNDVSHRVVGWTEEGQALVRIEHLNDDGELHALKLELIGPTSSESWVILEPEDEGNPKVRGARWTAAEAEIKARGVTIDASILPFSSELGQSFRAWTALPTGVELKVKSWSYDESMMQRTQLWARRDGQEGLVTILSENMNYQGGYNVVATYVHPASRSVAFVSAWSVTVVTGAEIDTGWKNPPACSSDTVHTIVGWTPAGGALVRSEATARGEEPCRLSLSLVGTTNDQAFHILKPEDRGDATLRARRWSEAEAKIQAAGVVIQADLQPSQGEVGRGGNALGQTLKVAAKPYDLMVRKTSVPSDANRIGLTLFAEEKGRSVEVALLSTVPNDRYPYGLETMWTHPGGMSVVFLPSYGPEAFLHVDMADITSAWGSDG